MRRKAVLAAISLSALIVGCEDDFTSPVNPEFDLSGLFTDTLAQGRADTVTFTPGRTGATTVDDCDTHKQQRCEARAGRNLHAEG